MGRRQRRWCPELAALPDDLIHAPVVDHDAARTAALNGSKRLKAG